MQPPTGIRPLRLGLKEDAQAWLELGRSTVPWEENVEGALVLQGGRTVHRITRAVEVSLSHLDPNETVRWLGEATVIDGPFVIGPRQRTVHPFSIQLPWGVPFHGEVRVYVAIRSGVWAQSVSVMVRSAPPAPGVVIAEQLGQALGMGVQRWGVSPEGALEAALAVPPNSRTYDKACLLLSRTDEGWRGELHVSSKPNSLARWKTDTYEFEAVGDPNDPGRVREQLEQLVRDAGIRTGKQRSLPLPAVPPAPTPADLPLPAAPVGRRYEPPSS